MFLSLKFLKKYKLDPLKFFGSHLVLQVSKPDKFYPKPDFDPRWPGLTDELYIQKIAKKTENWWQPRCLGALGAWKFMWCFDIRGARGKKKKILAKKIKYVLRAPRILFDHKNYPHRVHPSILVVTKFQIFLKVFAIFLNLFFTGQTWSTRSNAVNVLKNLVSDQTYLVLRLEGPNAYRKILRDQVYAFENLRDQKHAFFQKEKNTKEQIPGSDTDTNVCSCLEVALHFVLSR